MSTRTATFAIFISLAAATIGCVTVKSPDVKVATPAEETGCTGCIQVCQPGDGIMICTETCAPLPCDETYQHDKSGRNKGSKDGGRWQRSSDSDESPPLRTYAI